MKERSKPDAVLCDIDKTLALIGDRNPYDLTDCEVDTVNEPIAAILSAFASRATLILLTGRPKEHRAKTVAWLKQHCIPYDIVMMRETGDSRPDTVVKQELYQQHIEPHYSVIFALEDRSRVVQMFRSLGLTVLQVAEGNY